MNNIYLEFIRREAENSGLVIATVTESVGSTPQKPGSSALFCSKGLLTGTVGGGVVEGKVQESAVSGAGTKESVYLHFNLSNDISNKYEAICGGKTAVLVDANPQVHLPEFKKAAKSLSENKAGVLITMVTTLRGSKVLINRYWMSPDIIPVIPPEFMEKIGPEVEAMLSSRLAGDFRKLELAIPGEEPASMFFLEMLLPSDHLIIAGAGHIGKVLAHLGKMLDFEVTVIDDRKDFANKQNIPDADQIIVKDIGEAVRETVKNPKTYIVIVTRGHNNDAEALRSCIGSDAAYIGMIGSKAKTAKIRQDFILNKWSDEDQWRRVFTPIGLEIGSKTVEEIAISIAAQLIMIKNKAK